MSKISYKSLVSATVQVTNGGDADKAFDMQANVQIYGGKVNNVDAGSVSEEGTRLGDFNAYSDGALNMNFAGTAADEEKQVAVLSAVNAFVAAVKNASYTCNVTMEG